jgi:16S rRNA (cytosine967-C5)-methyltransferase
MKYTARNIALEILNGKDGPDTYADELLEATLDSGRLKAADAGLLHELVNGVLRQRGWLDYCLDHLCDKGIASLPIPIVNVMRLGLYQLLFLDRVPDHAIVDEAVKQAKESGAPGLSGLVNAILRHAKKKLERLEVPENPLFKSLAIRHSYPEFLVQRWLEELGEQETVALLESGNQRPSLILRVNKQKTDAGKLRKILADAGVESKVEKLCPDALRVASGAKVRQLPGYDEGLFAVQDTAAILVGMLCDAQPGDVIIDACAAPGGKSAHLAEDIGNEGKLYAVDKSRDKLGRLKENIKRMDLKNVKIMHGDSRRSMPGMPPVFDMALIDAPCSGLGVLRRRVDLRWRLKEEDIIRLASLSRQILAAISRKVRPGGALVFSTCTLTPEENRTVVERFLLENRQWKRVDARKHLPVAAHGLVNRAGALQIWPHRSETDGAYAVRFVKRNA